MSTATEVLPSSQVGVDNNATTSNNDVTAEHPLQNTW
jgi:hypothetical protein